MIYIGIDPGKKGGYAAIAGERGIAVSPWNDGQFIEDMRAVAGSGACIACVEKVGAMPGQGVTSMFNFGKSAGFIEGVLSALGIPYQLVTPQRWKKEFTLHNSKQKSVEVCKRLFRREPAADAEMQSGFGWHGGGASDGGIRKKENVKGE